MLRCGSPAAVARSLSFRLLGAANVPVAVAGSDATFRDVLPGVTARWSAENDSVKEQLILRRRNVARVFRYDVAGSAGLRVKTRPDGGLEFIDAAGNGAFVVPAGFGYDAKGFEAPPGTVSLSAKPGGSGWIVEMRLNGAWLRSPRTAFPVTVDPTIEVPSVAGDCKLDQELSSASFCGVGRLEVGWGNYGTFDHDHRSILRFDVQQALPPGATVTSANLHAYLAFRETGSGAKSIRVHRVTTPWTDDASWLNSAAGVAWATPGGDFASQIEAQVTADDTDTWYSWPITNLVAGWADGTMANQGLLLKDDGSHTDGAMVFASTESWPGQWPYLEIAYTGGAPEGPALHLTGGLRTPLSGDRSLDATATSDDGVRRVAIWLDPDLDPILDEATVEEAVCAPGCPDELTGEFTLPAALTEGRHTMLVRAEDDAGGVTRKRWDFRVAALGAADRSRLGLEQWFQYDATPAGGDSNLYVNADTGNLIWHSVPVVDPGRGLSTVVNLTYNSLDHGGFVRDALGHVPLYAAGTGELTDDLLAPLSYSEAGNGFSISVSGPTRINEPLHGVVAAAAAPVDGMKIRMTDADGTEHTFSYAAGKWVSPPGLNMHLRRFNATGSVLDPVPDSWAMTRTDGVTHFFDDLGFLTSTKDRNGNALVYNYDRVNAFDGAGCLTSDVIGTLYPGAEPRLCIRRLVSVTDPAGRDLTISYEQGGFLDLPVDDMLPEIPDDQFGLVGGNSRISKITDHAGREYTFQYDADGYLVRFVEAANKPDARVTGFTYEAPTHGLNNVGDDRMLDEVQDIRDDEINARTHINYEDRQPLPAGEDRAERRPYQVTKRSDNYKQFFWDENTFEVRELLDDQTGHLGSTFHEIDEDGRPASVTDALGTITTLAWSDDNKVTRLTRAFGTGDESVTDYTYDTANGTGVLEAQTAYPSWPATTGARTTDLQWVFGAGRHQGLGDATGHFVADLVAFENPKPGTGWVFTIDPVHPETGNVTRRTDAAGNHADTTYDGFGQITSETDELGHDVQYSNFHATGQPGSVLDERENTWRYKYDPVGNVTTVIDPRAASSVVGNEGDPFTTTLSYDSFDRLTREHIPKRSEDDIFITRTRTFDRNGNVVSSIDGRGQETDIDYTAMDLPSVVTAPGSNGPEITRYAYDAGDRLIGTIAPKGDGLTSIEDVVESQAGECVNEDPPLDYLTRYCLDDIGRVLAQVRYSTRSGDPSNLITSYAYDRRDNLVGMVDPNRNAGRSAGVAIAAALAPADQRMAYAYNKVDEQTTDTEKPTEAGAPDTVWTYVYDANGNRVEIHHPRGDNIRTHISYDHRDQVIAVEDPLGHLTCLERQEDGRVTAETTPRGTAGNHAACTDGNIVTNYDFYTTKYDYDPAGDLLSRSIPHADGQYGRDNTDLDAWRVQYDRNEVGDPTTITDARGNPFTNTFLDTGELRTTNRPSFWQVRDGVVVERPGRSSNAEKSDSTPSRHSTLGQTDFGRVDPEPLPRLLPMAGHTEFSYDGELNLLAVENAAADVRTFDYDPAGRVDEQTWPFKSGNPITHEFAYDKNGNVIDFFDGIEHTTYAYDGYDRQIQETAPGAKNTDDTDPVFDEVTRFRYDANDNVRFVETPRGVATGTADDFTFETAYDSLDRKRFDKVPDDGTTSYTYDVASNVKTVTHPRGQGRTGEELESFQTRMDYDNADRLVTSREKVTDGSVLDDLITTYGYDADDNMTSVTAPGAEDDEVTTRVFDGRGLPWKITRGTGDDARTSIVEFDANGNLHRIVNPRGVNANGDAAEDEGEPDAASRNANVFIYGNNDLLIERRLPWDDNNSENAHQYRTKFQRNDPLFRVTSILSPHEVEDNKVPRTSYSYYATDWIASVSDQKLSDPDSDVVFENRLVDYDYDKRGAQTEWKSKNAGETSAGRHIKRTFWPNGQLKTRIAKKTVEADDATTARRYEYFYNRNESLAAMNDIRGERDETAQDPEDDPNDRLTKISRDPVERQLDVNETWTNGKDSRFAYDIAGNVVTRRTDGKIQPDDSFGGDDRKLTTFEYDSLDREFRMVVDPMTGADREAITNYWPSGRKQSRRKPNGTSDRWSFDTRGMVTRHERVRAGETDPEDDDVDYRYDANGNRDRDERGTYVFNVRDQLTKWTKSNGRVTDYVLDGDGQITSKTVDPPDGPASTTTYKYRGERLRWSETNDVRAYFRYDDLGNVVRIVHHAKDVNGEFPEVNDNAPQSSGCEEVPNDVANNETYFCYDEFERLRLSKGAGITDKPQRIEYDGLDRRDSRTFERDSTPRTRDYSYVGTSEALSREVELDGDKHFFDYDSLGDRVGQQVTSSAGATSRYRAYVKDPNGSVLGLEDDNGEVDEGGSDNKVARYEYDPYGELENADDLNTDAADNPFRFEGFYFDSGVKTYDMYARAYRPEAGRFLTQDRLASADQDLLLQADPLTQNRYTFAGGNPVNTVEFDGHDNHAMDTHAHHGCFTCGGSKRAERATNEQGEAASGGSSETPATFPNTQTFDDLSARTAEAAVANAREERSDDRGFFLNAKASWNRGVRNVAKDTAESTYNSAKATPGIVWRHFKYHCQVSVHPKPGCPTLREYAMVLETGTTVTGVGGLLRAGAMKAGAPIASGIAGKLTPNATRAAPEIKAGAAGGETAGKAFPQSVRQAALNENPSTCVFCRMETGSPEVDHAIARARRGDATIENAQTSCPHCNASKGARDYPVNPPPGYRGPWPPPWWRR